MVVQHMKMIRRMMFWGLVLVVVVSAENEPRAKPTGCLKNQYYDVKYGVCKNCSVCPGFNIIIRQPCEAYLDTICGPFIEFDKFHQAPIINLLPHHNESDQYSTESTEEENYGSTKAHASVPVEIIKDGQWYTLAMALVGVLSFVALFVVIYIVFYCFVCRKRREEKELIYDSESLAPSAPETPRLLQTYVPSRDRLKKHMVTSYTEESDDSSGTTSNTIVVMPMQYIPIVSNDMTEYEADNSGQTVSSSSTNYVYFKAPENGSV